MDTPPRAETLPTAQSLFEQHFWPLYPPDVRADPTRYRDEDANPARNPSIEAHLAEAAELFAQNAPRLFDMPSKEPLPFTAEGVARLSHALDRSARDRLIAQSKPGDPQGALFNAVVHAAMYVGEVIVRAHKGAWSARRPLWESVVKLAPEHTAGGPSAKHTPRGVPPFHWVLKHLDDRAIDEGPLGYRFRVHVEHATVDLDALPVITVAKKLPDLKEPTYDLLVKYLHQHLPSLRDVGEGFPSAREFTERRYARVGFTPMHGGRVLVLHGQTHSQKQGETETPGLVELHWLTLAGWHHADALPSDDHPPYFARAVGEHLEVTLAWKGKPHTHTVGFRGHRH